MVNLGPSVNVAAGTQKWVINVGDEVSATPFVDSSGNTFFAAANKIYAYNANGNKVGELTLKDADNNAVDVTAPAAFNNNTLFFGDAVGDFHAIDISDPTNPHEKTNFPVSLDTNSTQFEYNAPAIDCNGNAYILSGSRQLYKVSTSGTKTSLGNFPDPNSTNFSLLGISGSWPAGASTSSRYASPVVDTDHNRVITGSQAGLRMVNLNGDNSSKTLFVPDIACTSSGCSSTVAPLDTAMNSPLALDSSGMAYVVSESGTLYKFDPGGQTADVTISSSLKKGVLDEEWAVFVGEGDSSPVIGSDGTVYVASENGILKVINGDTGAQIKEIGLGNVVEFSAPAIGQGPDGKDIIYVATEGGTLYAFNGYNNGTGSFLTERFRKDLGAPARTNLTVGGDGTVYAGTIGGEVYSIYGDSVGLAGEWSKAQGGINGTGRVPGGGCS